MSSGALPMEGVRWFFSFRKSSQWQRALQMLAVSWAALLLLFWRDTVHIVDIWWNSSTFNHCLLIMPIIGWLVWQRREELAQLTPSTWKLPLLWFGAGAGGWLLGEAAGVALTRQAGLVLMLQGSAMSVLGPQVTRCLTFPIFFMLFMIPLGAELVPPLQTLTAQMCMFLLGLTGIPAHIDGIFITTRGGYFRVAEACSGIEFLLAMIAYGALVSNLCFKSWWRRAAFMLLSVVVPVLANGIRAFGTIYIAEHTGIEFAASWDHVFYGWIFFAVVMAIVMAIGWRFFDRKADAPAIDMERLKAIALPKSGRSFMLGSMAAMTLAPMAWSALVMNRAGDLPAHIPLPKVAGWQVVSYEPTKPWMPHFAGSDHYLYGRYRHGSGAEVDFFAVAYDSQIDGKEIVGYGQGAIAPDSNWSWVADIAAPAGAKAERIKTAGPLSRDVMSYYHINGTTTGSATQVKLETLKSRLFAGDPRAVGILLSAEHKNGQSPRAAIDKFIKDIGNIDKVADDMIAVR